MNNKYKNLIKDTFIFAVGGIGTKLILFFLVPLYTNYLSTDEYGITDLIFTVSQFILPFVSVVIHDAVIRFGLSNKEKREDVLLCGLVVCGLGSLITAALTPVIGLYTPIAKWKWFICIYVMLTMLNQIQSNYIKAKDKNKLFVGISIVQTLVSALSNILFIVVIPLGIEGYILSSMISTLLGSVAMFFLGGIYKDLSKSRFSMDSFKRMLIFSVPLILNNVSWWAIHSANKIIVEAVLGASVLGIYTVATKIPSLINVMITIFQQAWGISSVKEIESSNDNKFYATVFEFISFIAFAMGIGLILIIKPMMTVYVGKDFFESWRYIPLLLASATFSAVSSYFVSMYAALKKSMNNMLTTLLSAALSIIVSLLLIKHIGLWAAIVGTFVAYFVMAVIRMIDTSRYVKMKINVVRFILNSVILISEAVLVSMEIHIYLVSSVAIILFIMVNFSFIKGLLKNLKGIKNA